MARSPFFLWFDMLQASFDAGVTVERRLALMAEAAQRGTLLAEPEMWRMGPEKLAALASGMTAAWFAGARQMQALALAPLNASTAIASAALAPAHRKVRDNARRLVRRRQRVRRRGK